MYEEFRNKKYPVSLKFDCRKMPKSAVIEFAEKLMMYMEVQIIGGSIVYAKGKVTNFEYARVWRFVDEYGADFD